jgi:hypothetical protein
MQAKSIRRVANPSRKQEGKKKMLKRRGNVLPPRL